MQYKIIANKEDTHIHSSIYAANRAFKSFGSEHKFNAPQIQAYPNIDGLLSTLKFDNGVPSEISYVKSMNLWLFQDHSLFYICLRLQQLMGRAPTENLSLINWDQHEDLYPWKGHDGRGKDAFLRQGQPDYFSMVKEGDSFSPLVNHFYRNVGIASYAYPFVWDMSLKNFIWRTNKTICLGDAKSERFDFKWSNSSKHFRPSNGDFAHRSINLHDLTSTRRSEFKKMLMAMTNTNFLHTPDLDSFYDNFAGIRIGTRRINAFKKDLDFIKTKPKLYPFGTFMATSDSRFINPRTIEGLTKEILTSYKPIEQAMIDNKDQMKKLVIYPQGSL